VRDEALIKKMCPLKDVHCASKITINPQLEVALSDGI
jgi:hypothetical protein